MIEFSMQHEEKNFYFKCDLNKLMELREDEDPLKCVKLIDIVEKQEGNNEEIL